MMLCFFSLSALAEQRLIELSDGSKIKGEIVSMTGDTWTIRTELLGEVTVDGSRIRGIGSLTSGTSAPPPAASGPSPQASTLGAIRSSIASDAGLMASIMTLRSDPQVQAILSDPEVMAAIRNLDLEALQSNPKFKALMNNPEVRSITSNLQ